MTIHDYRWRLLWAPAQCRRCLRALAEGDIVAHSETDGILCEECHDVALGAVGEFLASLVSMNEDR